MEFHTLYFTWSWLLWIFASPSASCFLCQPPHRSIRELQISCSASRGITSSPAMNAVLSFLTLFLIKRLCDYEGLIFNFALIVCSSRPLRSFAVHGAVWLLAWLQWGLSQRRPKKSGRDSASHGNADFQLLTTLLLSPLKRSTCGNYWNTWLWCWWLVGMSKIDQLVCHWVISISQIEPHSASILWRSVCCILGTLGVQPLGNLS